MKSNKYLTIGLLTGFISGRKVGGVVLEKATALVKMVLES